MIHNVCHSLHSPTISSNAFPQLQLKYRCTAALWKEFTHVVQVSQIRKAVSVEQCLHRIAETRSWDWNSVMPETNQIMLCIVIKQHHPFLVLDFHSVGIDGRKQILHKCNDQRMMLWFLKVGHHNQRTGRPTVLYIEKLPSGSLDVTYQRVRNNFEWDCWTLTLKSLIKGPAGTGPHLWNFDELQIETSICREESHDMADSQWTTNFQKVTRLVEFPLLHASSYLIIRIQSAEV